jgi:hypothetical protein
MVSGKPPRHSKSKAEPVTIDLDAKDVKAISADVDAAKTDEKPGDKTPVATATPDVSETKPEAATTGKPAPVWDQPKKNPIEPEPNVGKTESVAAASKAESPEDKQKGPVSTAPVPPKADAKPMTGTAGFLQRIWRGHRCKTIDHDLIFRTGQFRTGEAIHITTGGTQTSGDLRPDRCGYRRRPCGARRRRQHAICRYPALR